MTRSGSSPIRLRLVQGLALGLVCGALLGALQLGGAFDRFDRELLDLRYKLRGERRASDRIVLVEIDDATIGSFEHRWPLPRDLYALLLDVLGRSGATAIGVDVLFLGPSVHDPRFDPLLAAVTAANPHIVHSFMVLEEGRAPALEVLLSERESAILARHGVAWDAPGLQRAGVASVPFEELLDAATGLGHVAVSVDPDGVVRRLPLVVELHGAAFPSLALRLAGMARGQTALPGLRVRGRELEVEWPGGGSLRAPLDADGATSILFAGDRDAFQHLSMLDVLGWYKNGELARLRHAFAGKIVLVGTTAVREVATDVGTTPVADATPLVYVHANALDALLGARFLAPLPGPVRAAALLGGGAGIGALVAVVPLPVAAGVVAAAVILVAGLVQLLFMTLRLELPPAAFLLLPPAAYAVVASYRFVFLERRARESDRELETARTIQKGLLPAVLASVPGLDLYGTNLPAREVGGDYYDFVPLGDGRLALAVGDVSGKGVPAALLMSHLRASLHSEVRAAGGPRQVVSSMDALLFRATEPGRYATFFLGIVSPANGELRFCNAGHCPALLVHDGELEMLGATGVPLGMFEGSQHAEQQRRLGPGDVLVIYSDGVTEATWKGEFYGEERLLPLVAGLAREVRDAAAIGQRILDHVREFTHGDLGGDDVTLVVVRKS